MMKHKRAYTAIGILIGLAATAAAIWHFVWLKPYSVTGAELQARYAYKEELTPRDAHSVDIRLQSFDGALLNGRIVYPSDPEQAARPFPVLIGVSDDVNPPLFAGEAALLNGTGRQRRMNALKWAEPRAGLC